MPIRAIVSIVVFIGIGALAVLLAGSMSGQSRPSRGWTPASGPAPMKLADIRQVMRKLRPLHKVLGKPKPGEWLAEHREDGQTFDQYISSEPVVPTKDRHTIYIQPLGTFTKPQRKVVELSAEFIRLYYNMPVTISKDTPLSVIPARARRTHPSWGDKQILSTYVLDELLKPALPKDAFACIAFTSSDLWPGENWNFVFGQASLRDRVGVWSIYRFGDPGKSADGFALCLRRTMSTGVHELGHMFSMQHCIAFECVMCGSNNLPEADSRPLALCPVCLGKVLWATGAHATPRYEALEQFCRQNKLKDDADFYRKSLQTLAPSTRPAK